MIRDPPVPFRACPRRGWNPETTPDRRGVKPRECRRPCQAFALGSKPETDALRVVRHRIGLGLEPVEAHIQTLSPGPVDSLGGQVNLDGCDHFVQGVPHCEQVLGDGIQDCAQLGPVGLAPFEREPVALTFPLRGQRRPLSLPFRFDGPPCVLVHDDRGCQRTQGAEDQSSNRDS